MINDTRQQPTVRSNKTAGHRERQAPPSSENELLVTN
jgi:hypothetical protein